MPIRSFIRTLRAQWLGQFLRDIRSERGLTRTLVAEHLNRDQSALGRYELAEWPIPRADVVMLLELYGIHHRAKRDHLLRLAEDLWRTHHWRPDPDDDPDAPFITQPWLAMRAERLCLFDPGIVPEPLRTPRYGDLILRSTHSGRKDPSLAEQHRDLQRALAATETKIEAVVGECALHREIGGVDTLRAQLQHLRTLAQNHRAEIRVLPTDVALHPGLGGPFWLFEMPHPQPPVGYLDGIAGQLYVELPHAERFVDTYRQLADAALGLNESAALIEARITALA